MSFAAAAAFLAPMVVPALTGAAIGAGTGLLTGDGFSDDDWWKGALMGLGGGALSGAMPQLQGMMGAKGMGGGQLGANLAAGPIDVPIFDGGFGIDSFSGELAGKDWTPFFNNVTEGGKYIGTNPDLMGVKSGLGFLGPSGAASLDSFIPSQGTMIKGLLGSKLIGALRPGEGSQGQQPPPPNFARAGQAPGLPYRQPIQVGSMFGQRQPFMGGGGRYS